MSRIPTKNPEKSCDQARNTLIQYSPTPILDAAGFSHCLSTYIQ
jgi:hypothetical protein